MLISVGEAGSKGKAASLNASDRSAILDLISDYSYTYDSKDAEGWLALFTDDATWRAFFGPSNTLVFDVNGKTDLRDFVNGLMAGLATRGIQSRHYQTNTKLTKIDHEHVTGITMISVQWQFENEATPRPVHTGVYVDDFVKVGGEWKFKNRDTFIDHN